MIDLIIVQRRKDLGGFEVGRVLPFAQRRMVGPFIFLDHMGPAQFAAGFPRSVDVRPHPHIGLSTLSYLFEGEMTHRDSVGAVQPIRPGEVNWMTAGRGITHSERFERHRAEGGTMHGIQAWVALPEHEAECEPAFEHYEEADAPSYQSGGLHARLVAGSAFGGSDCVAGTGGGTVFGGAGLPALSSANRSASSAASFGRRSGLLATHFVTSAMKPADAPASCKSSAASMPGDSVSRPVIMWKAITPSA